MRVRELIRLLQRFDPEAEVHLRTDRAGGVYHIHPEIVVVDYGGGPLLAATPDLRPTTIYVGVAAAGGSMQRPPADLAVDLGQYPDEEVAARVRDFYIVHEAIDAPLTFPDFDYDDWIPPRTISGEYNPHIARILRDKLLGD